MKFAKLKSFKKNGYFFFCGFKNKNGSFVLSYHIRHIFKKLYL